MKTMVQKVRQFLLFSMALLAVTSAWAVPPLSYTLDPVEFEGVPFFDCRPFGMDFYVLADWTQHEYGKVHFDKDGNWVKVNGFTFNTDQRAYNSQDPSKEVTADDLAGTGEHNHFVAYYDENQVAVFYKQSGIYFRLVVPGYGKVAVNAGTIESQFDGNVWTVTKFTPNRLWSEEDAYAVCSFLQ